MKSRFKKPYTTTPTQQEEEEEEENIDISQDSPHSTNTFNIDGSVTSLSSSSKKSKRAIEKRVVQILIKEVHGSRALKVESNTPPSDSWAWRKYGQKPIKGSPYPRGYYRCSSCKGCPARKQMERSRVDPTMLIITYSSDHNHPWPLSRKNTTRSAAKKPKPDPIEPDQFVGEDLGWLGEIDTTSSAILESQILAEFDGDVASVMLPVDEEEELLFADLGELPECSTVFRHGLFDARRRLTAPTTS